MNKNVIKGVAIIAIVCIFAFVFRMTRQIKSPNTDKQAEQKPAEILHAPSAGTANLQTTNTAPMSKMDEKARQKKRLQELLTEVEAARDPSTVVIRKWPECWNPAFNEAWPFTNEVTNISQLLERLEANSASGQSGVSEAIQKGQDKWTKDPEQRIAANSLCILGAALFAQPSEVNPNPSAKLPLLFTSRENELPVTVGDVVSYQAIEESARLQDSMQKLSDGDLQTWIDLGKAANPVYRLMAVNVFSKYDTTPDQANAFYSTYLNESEPAINEALYYSLGQRDDSIAKKLLPQIQAKMQSTK